MGCRAVVHHPGRPGGVGRGERGAGRGGSWCDVEERVGEVTGEPAQHRLVGGLLDAMGLLELVEQVEDLPAPPGLPSSQRSAEVQQLRLTVDEAGHDQRGGVPMRSV